MFFQKKLVNKFTRVKVVIILNSHNGNVIFIVFISKM